MQLGLGMIRRRLTFLLADVSLDSAWHWGWGGPYAFAIPASKGGEGASQRAGQTLPLKHLIVHLLNIICTDIGQIINLFLYLFTYLFILFCLFTKTVFT